MLRILADFFGLFLLGKKAPSVFLRKEFDRFSRQLSLIAHWYRRIFLRHTRIVVVVGSLGKTTTTHALRRALGCSDRSFSYSNYGASLALNLMRVRPGDRCCVLEVGIGGPGQMARYARMIRPDAVVVTSIASDHHRSLPTLEDTRREKVKMVRALRSGGLAVLNGDDPHVAWMATQTQAPVRMLYPERPLPVPMENPLWGGKMVFPVLAARLMAEVEGVPAALVSRRLSQLNAVDSRMQHLILPNGAQLWDDSYKNGIETIFAALEAFASFPGARKIVVIGNIEEPRGVEGDRNREVGHRLAGVADLVLLVGSKSLKSMRAGGVLAGMRPEQFVYLGVDLPAVEAHLREVLREGDSLLIKGPSVMRLRRLVLALSGHQVGCRVRLCRVKINGCDRCPLLAAPKRWTRNRLIARYLGV